MKKIMSISLAFLLFVPCNAYQTKFISQEIEYTIIEMGKWIYTLFPEELCALLGQSFSPAPTITAAQLKERMGTDKDLLVINVLSERVFNDCHIEGSINIPLHEIIQKTRELDKETQIVVYCALEECDASEKAYIMLSALDFKHVIEYPGGIFEWLNLGYPVIGACALPYLHQEDVKVLNLCSMSRKHISIG